MGLQVPCNHAPEIEVSILHTEAHCVLDLAPARNQVPGHFTWHRLEIVGCMLTRAAEMLLASARTSAGRLPEVLDTRT